MGKGMITTTKLIDFFICLFISLELLRWDRTPASSGLELTATALIGDTLVFVLH